MGSSRTVTALDEVLARQRPVLVGERSNVWGSRKFRRAVLRSDFGAASAVAAAQVKAGAHIVDVCLKDLGRDEGADMKALLEALAPRLHVPLMVDTGDPRVMRIADEHWPGPLVLNSTNLSQGREAFDTMARVAQGLGSPLVVGLMDEAGPTKTAQRRLEVARRSLEILVEDHGLAPEKVWWDALALPCGHESHFGSARETLATVGRLKAELPDQPVLLAISNVSYGLPAEVRPALDAVFLHHGVACGLDVAIVNPQTLPSYEEVPPRTRQRARELLLVDANDVAGARRARRLLVEPRPQTGGSEG